MNASQIGLSLILAFSGLCLAQSSVQPALQQASSPTPMIWNQIPAPDQSRAIPLGTTSPSTRQSEEWVLFREKRCVYNVSIATLLPVLPERTKSTGAAVIVAPGEAAALAAKAATSTIPIVFRIAADPLELGLVPSLNRPGANITGATGLNIEIGTKRVEVLHELVPRATNIALLVNPETPSVAEPNARDVEHARIARK